MRRRKPKVDPIEKRLAELSREVAALRDEVRRLASPRVVPVPYTPAPYWPHPYAPPWWHNRMTTITSGSCTQGSIQLAALNPTWKYQ